MGRQRQIRQIPLQEGISRRPATNRATGASNYDSLKARPGLASLMMLAPSLIRRDQHMGMSNQQREVLELLHNYGYSLVRQRKHRIYKHATGRIWVCPNTPSDTRSWNNNLARLKKSISYGLANGILQPPTARQPMSPELQAASSNLLVMPPAKASPICEPEPTSQPEVQTCMPVPDKKQRPKPPKTISINRVAEILAQITSDAFAAYKLTDRDTSTIVNPDKREYVQCLGDAFNRKVDRASRSAADRLTNVVRDMRKNRRTKKLRVRSQLYEKFHAIFEGDTLLELNLESNPEFSTYRFVLNLIGICMSHWGFLSKLSRTIYIRQEGTSYSYRYWEPEPGDRQDAA